MDTHFSPITWHSKHTHGHCKILLSVHHHWPIDVKSIASGVIKFRTGLCRKSESDSRDLILILLIL